MRVTQVLSAVGFRQWPDCISQADREYYLNRGTQIHHACELYDRGTLDMSSVDERIAGFLMGWVKFRNQIGGKILAIEMEVSNKSLGYKGRLDRIIGPSAICKQPVVADIKTNEADVYTRLQLAGYRLALRRKNVKRMSVSLFENGTYKAEVYDDDKKDEQTWTFCVGVASWLQKHKQIKGE